MSEIGTRRLRMRPSVFYLLFLALPSDSLAQERTIDVDAVRVLDRDTRREIRAIRPAVVRLETRSVLIEEGASVRRLLEAHGIRPDGDAYALVYSLNDSLYDVNEIQEGSRLTLPVVALVEGAPVAENDILVDVAVHSAEESALESQIQEAAAAAPPADGYAVAARQTASQLLEAVSSLASLSFDESGVDPQVMLSLQDDLALVEGVLTGLESSADPNLMTAARGITETIEAVKSCRQIRHRCLVPVQVYTVRVTDGDTVPNLQIYAASDGSYFGSTCHADHSCGKPFPGLTPNAQQDLVVDSDYQIWATGVDGSLLAGPKPYTPTRHTDNKVALPVPLP